MSVDQREKKRKAEALARNLQAIADADEAKRQMHYAGDGYVAPGTSNRALKQQQYRERTSLKRAIEEGKMAADNTSNTRGLGSEGSAIAIGSSEQMMSAEAARQEETRAATSVYVTGLPKTITWKALEPLFTAYGAVTRKKLYRDAQNVLKGDALISYRKEGSAARAIAELDSHTLEHDGGSYSIGVQQAESSVGRTRYVAPFPESHVCVHVTVNAHEV